jgi:hypothetical protein
MMGPIPTEYYGDQTRWFIARVIDAVPPAGLEGRIQIRIYGIHTDNVNDLPQRDLPWAQVMNPSNSYGVSGFGVMPHIQANAMVFGMFLDGSNSQLPLVLGSLPHIEYPTSVQASNRDEISVNPYAYDFNQSNSAYQDPKFWGDNTGQLNTGPESAANVARFFIDNGLSPKQASSIAGVLQTISNLDPIYEGGIAGYPTDSPRYAKFLQYCNRLEPQKNFESFDVQLMFVLHELHTSHKTAFAKMHVCPDIEGNLYGANIDGVDKKGNGMVAALDKYFVHPKTRFNKGIAEGNALAIYGSLGAR